MVEVCAKILYQVELQRTALEQMWGFSVEAELIENADRQDELCCYVSRVEDKSVAMQNGKQIQFFFHISKHFTKYKDISIISFTFYSFLQEKNSKKKIKTKVSLTLVYHFILFFIIILSFIFYVNMQFK